MITYLNGDATVPVGDGTKVIVHVCNDLGGWGRGFVLALSKRWPGPERAYRAWHAGSRDTPSFTLGSVQFVSVESDITVANMIAQVGYGHNNRNLHRSLETDTTPPIRYDALERCLEEVARVASETGTSVHMPRIGCGLAGGSWDRVEPIIERTLSMADVKSFVYDLM